MTNQSKWNIVINGGSNVNNYESNFRENSIGGIISVESPKVCPICQKIVGLEHSSKCQCEKENGHCEYCQSSGNDKQTCSCLREKKESSESQLITEWQNIHSSFTPELVQAWQAFGFTVEQCRDWVSINSPNYQAQTIWEPLYYAWLRDIKGYTPESLLNCSQEPELRKEYEQQCLKFQTGQVSSEELAKTEESKSNFTELLAKIKSDLSGYQKQFHQFQVEDQKIQVESEQLTNLNILHQTKEPQHQISTSSLLKQTQIKPVLKHQIGKGGYGEVYYGKWKSQDVAVKKLYLSPHNTSESDIQDIRKEINILKILRNRYIIQYYDTYSDNQELLIIMEYAKNGTLTKFINDNKEKEHNWSFNTNLIKQIALGLVYIHHEGIIHRDLKSMNILLANNYQVKISDFGLSKTKTVSSSQSKDMVGTLRWMAPELLRGKKYSEQSDIYSLGMIIWEIVAKCTVPFRDIDDNLLVLHIASGEKETTPSGVPENIRYIMEKSWESNPSERITLLSMFEMIKENESDLQDIHPNSSLKLSNTRLQNSQENDKFFDDFENLRITDLVYKLESEDLLPIEDDWTNIHLNFTNELVQSWTELNFTYSQVKDWLSIGLQPTDHHFCTWLRDELHFTPEKLLNDNTLNITDLREQFQEYQIYQEIPPKQN
ncbi:MAG: protein kinase [Candidatus Moeniiplasma glomeromycotorum]|nr:protein kinase [Candidatus Moeniiplasma glomeromycotorum]MCE8167258.1 protein kinase [Candidatus Moeniiplasma glomeromycotorum]MCE8168729.1 protein kinase [Candidatus Moeniiplasma glomeromycotorum]